MKKLSATAILATGRVWMDRKDGSDGQPAFFKRILWLAAFVNKLVFSRWRATYKKRLELDECTVDVVDKQGLSTRQSASAVGGPNQNRGPREQVVLRGDAVKQKLRSLQALRAVAAVLVVMLHTQATFTVKNGRVPFHDLFINGGTGVDLFFVLSGFIVTYIHADDWGKPGRAWNYLFNRLARIYPAVWIVTILTAAVVLAGFGGGFTAGKLSLWSFIGTALLLPQNNDIVGVIWSLKLEMLFYVVFLFLIIRPTVGWTLFALWQATGLIMALFMPHHRYGLLWFYCQPICFELCIGMLCAIVFIRKQKGTSMSPVVLWAALILGLGSFAVGILATRQPPGIERVLIFGTSSGVVITSLVMLESVGRVRIASWLVRLGDASYSIYLLHFSTITVISRFVFAVTKTLRLPVNDAMCLVVASMAIFVGVAFHQFVDRQLQRRLREARAFVVGRLRGAAGSYKGRAAHKLALTEESDRLCSANLGAVNLK